MARKHWVALATVDYLNTDGVRAFASPGDKRKGVFDAEFDAKQIARLKARNAIREATEKDLAADREAAAIEQTAVETETKPEPNPDGLDAKKVEDLVALADAETIDLGEAKKKADIIKVIREARAAKQAGGSSETGGGEGGGEGGGGAGGTGTDDGLLA